MNLALRLTLTTFGVKRILVVIIISLTMVVSLPMVAVFSIGSPTIDWLINTPDAKAAETRGFYMGGPVEGNTYAWGNCTWWVFAMRLWAGSPIPTTWGNANTWDDYSARDGYLVNHTPAIGSIFQSDEGEYGHVAYVIDIDPVNGDWTISEMNAPTLNVVSVRTFSHEAATYYKFIHNKIGEEPWIPKPLLSTPPYSTVN